ncbi:hypothetical protein GCM10028818_01330 [Spirosoma horti]
MDALLQALSFLPLRFSRNPVAYTIDAAPDSVADRQNLSYLLRLKKPKAYGSGEYNTLITLPGREFPPRAELGATVYPGAQFDVSVFLDDFLARTPPTPAQIGFVACADMITPYLTQTRVENAGVLLAGTDLTLPLEYALKGALSVEQFAGWRDQFFTTYLSQSRQFLTWQPRHKWVETNQPEFLYYLVNFTPKPAELRLRMDVTYQDGSIESMTPLTTASVSQYTVYSVPTGFVALGLPEREAATGKAVLKYQVWLSNEVNARLSEVRTYLVNRDYEANVLYLLFANSLGGYDTLRCTGQSSKRITVKGTDVQRALNPTYLPSSAELFRKNRTGERYLTVATGLKDGDQLDYLSDLVLSEDVFVVTQEGFVALTLPTSGDTTLELRQDDEDLAGRLMTFQYGKNEIGFSSLPSAPTVASRPTRWVPANAYCQIDDNGVRTGYMGAAKLELRYSDDGSLVKPLRSKPNVAGTEGYTIPVLSASCAPATTPFRNALIQKPGSYRRSNCGADQEATVATLTIAAGTFGAETAEQLQSRIDAALKAMDTQDNANLYGSCLANPAGYAYAVPDGFFHYRSNTPSRIGIETADAPYQGNAWTMQGRSQYTFGVGSNDLDFSISNFDAYQWRFFVYGTAYKQARLRLYKNGLLYRDDTFTFNRDGYEYYSLFGKESNGGTGYNSFASGDRLYMQLIDL